MRHRLRRGSAFVLFLVLAVRARAAAPSSPVYSAIWISSLTASWTGAPGDTFTAILSTGPSPSTNGFAGNRSSTTANAAATFFSLSANTTYYVDVKDATSGSAFTNFSATSTLASPPGASAPPTSGSTQILATWLSGDPTGTLFDCQASTAADFSVINAESQVADVEAILAGLTPNTLYYLRVQAINNNGIPSGFVSLPATYTTVSSPGLGFTSVGSAVATVIWNSNGNPNGTFYKAVISTGASPGANGFAGNVSSTTANLYASYSGLIPNTAYFAAVQALGSGGNSPFSSLGSTVTLANAPLSASPVSISSTQITIAWLANSNPSGTGYIAQASTSSNFFPSISRSASDVSAVFSSLSSNTSYYFRVEAVNLAGTPTSFTSLPTAMTLAVPPAVPVLSAAVLGTSSISWNWSSASSAAGYRVLDSNGANLSGSLSASATYWLESNLSTNTSHAHALVAFNSIGNSTSTQVAAATLAAPPIVSSVTIVGVSSMTLAWSENTNPSGTQYTAELWQQTGATTTLTTVSTSVVFSAVPGTTYYFDVFATNGGSSATAHTVEISTFLPFIAASIVTVYPDTGGSALLYTTNGPVTVTFPPGTFPVTVTATVSSPSFPHALSHAADLTATGVGTQIDVAPALQPSRPVSIAVGYRSGQMSAFSPSRLVMAYYDPTENLWVPIPSVSSPSLGQVIGQSRHLSIFQIMAVTPASDLTSPKVFPNPFRPALGHSLIAFSQLPPNTRVRIYTILGELVKDLSTDDTGIARWDATNRSGQSVASGAYFALAQAGGSKTVLKVMIQR